MVQQLAAEFICFLGGGEFQKLLLFGFDIPLKVQDALVNMFVMLNLI